MNIRGSDIADGTSRLGIRWQRKRLGLTQGELAERLNVDQGTISRWERGLGEPRPATYAALRDLLLRQDSQRAFMRVKAVIQNNLQLSMFYDAQNRMRAFSTQARDHYQERYNGVDINGCLGMEVGRFSRLIDSEQHWETLRAGGVGRDDVLLMRTTVNVRGFAHITHYEMIFDGGEYVGWYPTIVEKFRTQGTDISVKALEVVHLDDPGKLIRVK